MRFIAKLIRYWAFFLFLSGVGLQRAQAQSDLTDGLIGCYPMSGSTADHSGNKNNGILFDAQPAFDRFNRSNNGYLFNGSSAIRFPAPPFINSRTLTFSAWVYTVVNPSPGEAQFLFSLGNEEGFFAEILAREYWANISGFGIAGWKGNDLLPGSDVTFVLPQIKTWYHLAMVVSEDSTRYYINGLPSRGRKTGDVLPYWYQCSTCVVTLGTLPGRTNGYQGIIDDVTLHDRALSKDEIKQLFFQGLPCVEIAAEVADVLLCGPGSATLTATGGTEFRWYDQPAGGDLLFEGNPFNTPTITQTTTYYASVIVLGRESDRTKVTITVAPGLEVNCNFEGAKRHQDNITFSPIALGGSPPFRWIYNFADGTKPIASDTGSLSHMYTNPGHYPVGITVMDKNGCFASCTEDLHVDYQLMIPDIVTANDDTLNRVFSLFVSENGIALPYDGSRTFSIVIYDRWGKEIFSSSSPANGWTGRDQSSGIYFYQLRIGDDKRKGWVSLVR